MAKFCQNCGTPYEEGAVFCANCGTNLAAGVAPRRKKTAVTLEGVRNLAAKRLKVIMIFMLIATLLLGLAYVSGSYKLTCTVLSGGKIAGVVEAEAKSFYMNTNPVNVITNISGKEAPGANNCAKVLNVIYGICLLAVAAMVAWSLLEKACGGKGEKMFKLAALVATAATFVFALLFLILCRRTNDTNITYILEVPMSAWVNIAVFGGIAALTFLQPKKA